MKIDGKVHCFFEQSGTFKRQFLSLGIPAADYDIQDNFGETDNLIDLFKEIEFAYDGKSSLFDSISSDDLIFSFFPCIHFCDAKTLFFRGFHISQKTWTLRQKMEWSIKAAQERERFYLLLLKLFVIVDKFHLRMILENPYNFSGMTYLENNFIPPQIIDKNRYLRGDFFKKPTAYWFVNCNPTFQQSYQAAKHQKSILEAARSSQPGICSIERSMISSDYAHNFICDFILGIPSGNLCQLEFDF